MSNLPPKPIEEQDLFKTNKKIKSPNDRYEMDFTLETLGFHLVKRTNALTLKFEQAW